MIYERGTMNKIINKRIDKKIIFLTLILVFFAFLPIYNSFVNGIFGWYFKEIGFLKDIFELLMYLIVFLILGKIMPRLKGYFVIAVASIYFLSMGVFIPVVVSYLFIQILLIIGASFCALFNMSVKVRDNIGVEFLCGTTVWGTGAIFLSALKLGTINDLRVLTLALVILAVFNKKYAFNKEKILFYGYVKQLNCISYKEFLIHAGYVILFMISFARINTFLESDTSWYCLHPEYSLVGENSFYDYLGYTSFVYYYPKFKELLTLPISGLGESGYIIGANIWILVIIIIETYQFLKWKKLDKNSILLFNLLLFSAVGIVGVAGTGKSDILAIFYTITLYYFYDMFIKTKNWTWFILAISSGLVSYAVKYTSFLYTTIILIVIFCDLLYRAAKRKIDFRELKIKEIIWLIFGFITFSGVTFRTILLTGFPTCKKALSLWYNMGFRPKKFFESSILQSHKVDITTNPFERLFYMLFDPQKLDKIACQWLSNFVVFFVVFLLFIVFKKIKFEKRNVGFNLITNIALATAGLYYFLTMPRPDGNYFDLPLIVVSITVFKVLWYVVNKLGDVYKVFLKISMIILIMQNLAFVFVTHPSWGTATRFLTEELQYTGIVKTNEEKQIVKERKLIEKGIHKISEYISENCNGDLIILDSASTEDTSLDARILLSHDVFHPHLSCAVFDTYEKFKEYIEIAGVNGFIFNKAHNTYANFYDFANQYLEEFGYKTSIDDQNYIYYVLYK